VIADVSLMTITAVLIPEDFSDRVQSLARHKSSGASSLK
jgi:hypothetical protein